MSRMLVFVAVLGASTPAAAQSFSGADARATIDKYCVTCHNDRAKTGGLSLAIDLGDAGKHAIELEKAVRKLRSGAMPPAGSRRPDKAAYDALTVWIEQELD